MKNFPRRLSLLLLTAIFLLTFSLSISAADNPKNKLVTEDGYTSYYDAKGVLVKNKLVTIKNKTYFFDQNGHMRKDELFVYKKKTYYAASSGVLAKNKFITLEEKRYFFDKNCVRKTGWVTHGGHQYYCPNSGAVYKNIWKKIGSYYYYFRSTSYVAKNRWVEGYYVDKNGHRVGKAVSDSAQNSTATKKQIKMKPLRQNPELPTGCESVALTMVLKHYKFNISKTTIASSFLPKSGSGNFVTAFMGSPFSSSGGGIYAPGLTNTANKYLKSKKSSRRAYDLTGISFSNLYQYIDNGTPVIVWNSMYMRTPVPVSSYYTLGKRWTFYRYEHCVVLCGYNKKTQKVLINDPLSGLVWRNAKSFERIYNKLGKMAVVIQ